MVPKRLRISDDIFVLGHVSEVKNDDVVLVQQMQSSFLDSHRIGAIETTRLRFVEEPVETLKPHVFLRSQAINDIGHYV